MEEDGLYGILAEKNIREVQFGLHKRFDTWYGSAVYFNTETKKLGIHDEPGTKLVSVRKRMKQDKSDVSVIDNVETTGYWLDTLFVCEYCFKYTDIEEDLVRHEQVCSYKLKAPGRIKYKSPQYTIRRVKGSKHQMFCQCLCLFTKLYLDNKSVYFKLDHYEFYIVYESGSTVPMAFFSKDLVSYNQNNLACILTLPPYQRRRLGSLLIEFSYCLSRAEGIISGPELPLSPFGLVGYLRYWSQIICWHLCEGGLSEFQEVTIEDISTVTGMRINDVITTLKHLNCIENDSRILLHPLKQRLKGDSKSFMLEDEYLLLDD
ncbi:Histone acetyltransferase SAS2 [Nakaseomyces bracarensis]|uniref:histone acetyltransferase n=1 Tax=Nakaseomyces bracarensis TaxID=273131 RepID=A0ABR4NUW3_9SACH